MNFRVKSILKGMTTTPTIVMSVFFVVIFF